MTLVKTENGRRERGFTLVEVTIILLVLVILSGIMLPQLGNFNRLARYVKVKEDLGAICASLKKFIDEVMVVPFGQPGGGIATPTDPIGLLVGPGTPPDITPINGLTPGASNDIWDVAAVAGFFNMSNRLASALALQPNPEYHAMARG